MIRNKFSLSHTKLLSTDMGKLVPCSVFEVLPGDTIQMSSSALIRAAYLLSPVMHRVDVRIHHWFVPTRLVWADFEKFITGGPDGLDATVHPTMNIVITAGSLGDYLGLTPLAGAQTFSALAHRSYYLIWNEFYRDQDLQSPFTINTGNGNDTQTSGGIANVNWEKDYFTSARPWEQKGPTITLPLGTTAPVVTTGVTPTVTGQGVTNSNMRGITSNSSLNASALFTSTGDIAWGNQTGMRADLSTATAVTINTLRNALALQRYGEARARYGSRYVEYLRYLGVKSSDARLQLPEYLGGGRQTIQFSEVLQTGPEAGGAGVGKMRGHGIGAMRSNRFRRFIEEHGLVISLLSVRPKTMYMQGMPRMFNRRTKENYWQKELEHIGQQAVLNKEVYAAHATPDGTFGFQDRYDEYRRNENTVAGEFRSTLNFWHMARDFGSTPALNSTFVSCVPTERTFAVPSEDVIYAQVHNSIQARRMVAKFGSSFTF